MRALVRRNDQILASWRRAIARRREQARVFELEQTLTAAREELDAVREINRELLARQNRSAR